MKTRIEDIIFQNYGLTNTLGYDESENRGYLTFTCNQGTFIAVMAKHSEEVAFYKYEKRGKYYDY